MKENRGFPDGQIRERPRWGAHPGGPEEERLHRAAAGTGIRWGGPAEEQLSSWSFTGLQTKGCSLSFAAAF